MPNRKKIIKILLMERGKDLEWLSGQLGIRVQSLRNKLSRDNYSYRDYEEILRILGAELAVHTKEGWILK